MTRYDRLLSVSLFDGRERDVVFAGAWWRAVAAVPVVELLWIATGVAHIWYARAVGIVSQQYFGFATDGLVLLGVALSAFAPFALYHDRAWVAARSDWTPSSAYLLVVVPLLNAVIAVLYLSRRHRAVGLS